MTLFALAAVLALQATTPADPASAEAVAVMAPVEATFAALAARDGALLAPHFDPEARMIVALERPDGTRAIRRLTGLEFAAGLRPGTETFEEVMPDPVIAIDGDVAVVFGRYLFKVDGAVVHCGANHFDLIRKDGAWTIAGITWSQRTTGCEG
ncbi:nuclear transport factor 2 family protein [Brevundimonas sp.]|uniref:nuclear transport factor 2 family protein n=1 Tax=Brevundimonas sp. TaxID=1871086 RepID=UPI003D0E3E30